MDELDAIRRIGADTPQDDDAKARVRARVLGGGDDRPPRRRFSIVGVAIPALAVAAGLALILVVGPGGSDDEKPVLPERDGPAVAATATAQELFPGPGQAYYVKSRQQYQACTADGDTARCTLEEAGVAESWKSADQEGKRTGYRTTGLGRLGRWYIGNREFDRAELLAYTPTGAELLKMLQDGRGAGQGNGGETYPFTQLTDALRDYPLPLALRRAILDAFALVPGVKDEGETTDEAGRRGRAFSRVVSGTRERTILDPTDATLLQERSESVADGKFTGGAVYVEYAIVDRVGQRPGEAAPEQPTLAELAEIAGCQLRTDLPDEGSEHVKGTVDSYKTTPPTSGPHSVTPAPEGPARGRIFQPGEEPPVEQWVHSLEHGRIVYLYKPGSPSTATGALASLYEEEAGKGGGYHQLLMQDTTGMKYRYAAVAWRQLLGCPDMDEKTLAAFREFRATYTDKGPELVP